MTIEVEQEGIQTQLPVISKEEQRIELVAIDLKLKKAEEEKQSAQNTANEANNRIKNLKQERNKLLDFINSGEVVEIPVAVSYSPELEEEKTPSDEELSEYMDDKVLEEEETSLEHRHNALTNS